MKAFLVAIVALVAISGGAAVVLDMTAVSSSEKYSDKRTVRLGE